MTVNVVSTEERAEAKYDRSFGIAVKTEKKPRSVRLLPDGEEISFVYKDGYVSFRALTLKIFDMYIIEF